MSHFQYREAKYLTNIGVKCGFSYRDGKYLKHVGEEMGEKVSIYPMYGEMVICIRDYTFTNFKAALKCLQMISETEFVDDEESRSMEKVA